MATTTAVAQPHLGLDIEVASEAPFIRLGQHTCGMRKDIVEGEVYSIKFKFKNLGEVPFSSGSSMLLISWSNAQFVRWKVRIPELKSKEEQYAEFDGGKTAEKTEALSSGFGFFYCAWIKPENTKLSSLGGETSYHVGSEDPLCIRTIKATTWDTIYSKYSAIIAATGLGIIALQIIVQFLFWLLSQILAHL